jgi:hypothetical protein
MLPNNRHQDEQHRPGHARGHEELEEAQAVLGEADDQHDEEGQQGQGRGHRQLGGHGELLGEHPDQVQHGHEGEDREDERQERTAAITDHRAGEALVDQVVDGFGQGLHPAGHHGATR